MVIDIMNKANVGKKDLKAKKQKPDQNTPVNKNCEILMCDMNKKQTERTNKNYLKNWKEYFITQDQ